VALSFALMDETFAVVAAFALKAISTFKPHSALLSGVVRSWWLVVVAAAAQVVVVKPGHGPLWRRCWYWCWCCCLVLVSVMVFLFGAGVGAGTDTGGACFWWVRLSWRRSSSGL
jgi:hypothetical protein